MSDHGSESNGEWVVLNEDGDDFSFEAIDQPLNLEISYDAVCYAVSDSIRSSLSSEELEWQYEQFEDFISPCPYPHVQELHHRESDMEANEGEDSNVEDEIANKYASTTDIDEEECVDLVSVSKIHSYKHNRNDHLNFILNLMLALVVASAVGLGIGHFLGWSHKCYKGAILTTNAASNDVDFPQAVMFEQKVKNIESTEKKGIASVFSENLEDSTSCTNPQAECSSALQEIFNVHMDSDVFPDTIISETSILSDILELKPQEEPLQNNFSGSHIFPVSNIVMDINTAKFSDIEAAIKHFYDLKKVAAFDVDIESLYKDEINYFEFVLPKDNYIKEDEFERNKIIDKSERILSSYQKDILHNNEDSDEDALLKESFIMDKDPSLENNLTSKLRADLNDVIQSLTVIALTRLSDVSEEQPSSAEESGLVIKLYNDFKDLINIRLTDIDNFLLNSEFKKFQKFNAKYLQKMVYSLVDSVDYLMKVSFNTLSKDDKRINVYKFSRNVSKIIFNFNKKWEKNRKFWFESVEKVKFQGNQNRHFKKEKDKQGNRKVQFERRNYKNDKYRKYVMKS